MTHLDIAVARLRRNMAIAQLALETEPVVAAMVELQAEAVLSACEGVLAVTAAVDRATVVTVSPQAIGQHTADALAEALSGETPTHVPDSWRTE